LNNSPAGYCSELISYDEIVALGRAAAAQIAELDVQAHYVSHSVSGGGKLFRQQIVKSVPRNRIHAPQNMKMG